MAGESSLAASERMSIGSKLKESKMSAVSFNTIGFENSSQNTSNNKNSRNAKNMLNRFKSTSEFRTMADG